MLINLIFFTRIFPGNKLNLAGMAKKDEIHVALNRMILSPSGWRGIFASCGSENGFSGQISASHSFICAAGAFVFINYLKNRKPEDESRVNKYKPLVLLGTDTRPTGKAIVESMLPVLLSCGCEVHYAGIIAAPEIMVWAAGKKNEKVSCGFIYISASHNPVGYNGIKFGLDDGGVLEADEARKLISDFRIFLEKNENIELINTLVLKADSALLEQVYAGEKTAKEEALKSYYNFSNIVAWEGNSSITAGLIKCIKERALGIVCDFNGSARTVSIDREFLSSFGIKFDFINGEPGQIVHEILPEGKSLEPCCILLENAHVSDPSFLLGYMPDCDGDRGNLVIWDEEFSRTRALEAQEVFALACVAEFSYLVYTGTDMSKTAVVVNDPTSMRIDRIAQAFGIKVFRAEVGEANVVSLARRLREQGFIVRIFGEGSNGGNIIFPSAVRDPINTLITMIKLLSLRSSQETCGLFEIWCKYSGQMEKYRSDFCLSDIINSLPPFVTTSVSSDDAVMSIGSKDHGQLKDRYEKIFKKEWEEKKDELKLRFGFCSWEAIAYNGMEEKRSLSRFGEAGSGGLKIIFRNENDTEIASVWMRGSATEPVFRIIADTEGSAETEQFLINWQRKMIMEADK